MSQLRFDYDTTTKRLQRKTDMFIFCSRRIASNGSRRARYLVVGMSDRSRIAIVITAYAISYKLQQFKLL